MKETYVYLNFTQGQRSRHTHVELHLYTSILYVHYLHLIAVILCAEVFWVALMEQ